MEQKISLKNNFSLIFLISLLLLSVSSGLAASAPTCSQVSFEGTGSSENPYHVSSLHQLQCIEKNPSATYELTDSIDAANTRTWDTGFKPLETFNGELEGQNHTITDLHIERPGKGYTGLFSRVGADGSVENLSIVNSNIQGAWQTGALAGENHGKISRVYSSGRIEGEGNVGGIVGANNGTVNFSYSRVEVSGVDQTGGLIGQNYIAGILSQSYSNGTVQIENTGGGLVGYNKGRVESVYSISEVNSESWNYSGSFIGFNPGSISSGYWLEDENPRSYWYKTPTSNYENINGSSLEKELMTGDACGMKGFNFSSHWDTRENGFPHLQISEKPENESRSCENYVESSENNGTWNPITTLLILLGIGIIAFIQYRILIYFDRIVL